MTQTELLLYLISCALHDAQPEEALLAGLDLGELYRLAAAHSLTACVSPAVERTAAFAQADPAAQKTWAEARNKAIRRQLMMEAERKQIFSCLEQAGIWYMPLKGCILADWYPHAWMREMADCDVLYDAARMTDVQQVFLRRGYTGSNLGKGNHDIYKKAPVFHYEMHRTLFSQQAYPEIAAYYRDVEDRLIRDPDGGCLRHFSDNDFYVHIVVHAGKHFNGAGAGIRMLVDAWVLYRHLADCLDMTYVRHQLDRLGLTAFEETSRSLAEKLFASPTRPDRLALSEDEQKMLAFCTHSATYGTLDTMVRRKLKKQNGGAGKVSPWVKVRYLLSRLFPGPRQIAEGYPFFSRYPVFLPALWIFRIVRCFFRGRSAGYLREVASVQKISELDD